MNQQFQFKKRYGQNFLKNKDIVRKISEVAVFEKPALVLEVGPGAGVLTIALAERADRVLAYEIDISLEDILLSNIQAYSNITVLFQDFLQADLMKDLHDFTYEHLYFVSNVPYYITTPILFKLIDSLLPFQKIVMMVQKEVGERFCATPGKKEYGALSVLLNYYFKIKKEFIVDRNQFQPRPNVDSMVVSFTARQDKEVLKNHQLFRKLVHDSFQYKRKTLRNNLKSYPLLLIEKVLENYGFDLSIRAEQLPYQVFVAIANTL